MDPRIEAWVKAFYAVRGWDMTPAPVTNPGDMQVDDPMQAANVLRIEYGNTVKVLEQLRLWPPDGIDPEGSLFAAADEHRDEADTAIVEGELEAAREALDALQKQIHKIATWRKPGKAPPSPPPVPDGVLGYEWHRIDPPERQQFRIGLAFVEAEAPEDDGNQTGMTGLPDIVELKSLAGRPRGKHGGAQGQHVTAFVTLRETLVSACDGRTEDEAWENMQHLFAGLLLFPAFGPEGMPDGLDPALVARIRGIARQDEDVLGDMTLSEAMALYIEVRDSLPGATLARGSYKDTTGKAEARAVAEISRAEGTLDYPLEGEDGEGRPMSRKDADALVRQMLRLVDRGGAHRLTDATARRHAMETYVLGMAQAYPRVFACPCLVEDDDEEETAGDLTTVGELLIERANLVFAQAPDPEAGEDGEDDIDEDGDTLASDLQVADLTDRAKQCAAMPVLRPTGARPKIESFSVGLDQVPGKPLRLDFTGRPSDSLKDAGKMGDHTCAMRLMTAAVSNALLQGDEAMPRRSTLKARVEDLLRTFDPEGYAPLFDLAVLRGGIQDEEDGEEDEEEEEEEEEDDTGDSSEAVTHRRRVQMMRQQVQILRDACEKLAVNGDAPVDSQTLLAIGEDAMRLVDQRPTAVSYRKGKSDGRGEGKAAGTLDDYERRLKAADGNTVKIGWAEAIKAALLTLYDPASANFLTFGVVEDDQQGATLAKLVDEFLWFARSAYPRCCAEVGELALKAAIQEKIVLTHHDEDEKDGDHSSDEDELDESEDEEDKKAKKRRLSSAKGKSSSQVAKKPRPRGEDDEEDD
ncbi:MAG: hypothetical protein KF887_14130 [Paracoccaceae bacterium]|nr:MAG: hypothetical protein KF887_14130 [Paracoccaceae bacterium]